jgi:hypothetical protein
LRSTIRFHTQDMHGDLFAPTGIPVFKATAR